MTLQTWRTLYVAWMSAICKIMVQLFVLCW